MGMVLSWAPELACLVAQLVVMVVAYLGLAALLRVEELSYLVATMRELLGRRRFDD